ncbi:MAG: hypothetical protein OHK0012_05280 [Synechococcales cyanobacterium]
MVVIIMSRNHRWLFGLISLVVAAGSPVWGQSQIIRRLSTPAPDRPTDVVPATPPASALPSPVPTAMPTRFPSSVVPSIDLMTEWHIQNNVCTGAWSPEEITALFPQLSVEDIRLICQQNP